MHKEAMKLPLRLGSAKRDTKNGGEFYIVKDAEGAWIGDIRAEHAPEIVASMNGVIKDAERYRWLKANHLQTGPDSWIRTGEDLEEAIDEAMRELRRR